MKKLFTFIITSFLVSYFSLAQTADVASNLSLSDIGNFNGSADMAIAFDEAAGDTTVSEYRAIVVKASATFNVDSAILVGAANYKSYIAPLAANVVDTLAANATDSDGDLVVAGVSYNLYVLSIADGVNATTDSLSGASNALTLMDPTINSIPFVEDFESITTPNLPSEWTTEGEVGSDLFLTGTSQTANGANFFPVTPHTKFVYSNDDVCNCDKSVDYLNSPLIMVPSGLTVNLKCAIFQDDTYGGAGQILISNDFGSTWNNIYTHSLVTEWVNVNVDISTYAGDTIMVRFHYDDQGVWGSGMAIDDISIAEKPDFDISLNSVDLDLNYTKIPLQQISGGVNVNANVSNIGVNTATNVVLNLDVNSGEFTTTSTGISLNSDQDQDISLDAFVPTSTGFYSFDLDVTMDETDENTLDNTYSFEFEVSDTTYSRGLGAAGRLGEALVDYNNNEFGMLFEVFQDDTASSISVEIVNPIEDALVQVKLYEEISSGVFFEVAASDTSFIPLDITQDEVYILTLPLSFAPVISGTNYLATILEFNGNESIGMAIDGANYIDGVAYTSSDAVDNEFQLNDQFWNGSFLWPISLNVGENIYTSVKEKIELTSISLMPNPAKDIVTLTSVSDYKTINVVDVTGKTVMTVTNTSKSNVTLDVSTLEAGVYIVKATGENVVATERLIIE